MKTDTCEIIDRNLEMQDLGKLGMSFTTKPLVFGGLAMEYYGLRKRGDDIDLIVSFEDYATLERMFPESRKDSWGDLGVKVHGFEMFRTVWKLDYEFLSKESFEYRDYRVISLDMLLLMKVLAMDSGEKQRNDLELIKRLILDNNQRKDILEFMNTHVDSYLASPDGFVYNGEYKE